jgi:hypothetical protein
MLLLYERGYEMNNRHLFQIEVFWAMKPRRWEPTSGSTLRIEKIISCKNASIHIQYRGQSEQSAHRCENMKTYIRYLFVAGDKYLHLPLDDEKILRQFLRPCKYYPKSAYDKVSNGEASPRLVHLKRDVFVMIRAHVFDQCTNSVEPCS